MCVCVYIFSFIAKCSVPRTIPKSMWESQTIVTCQEEQTNRTFFWLGLNKKKKKSSYWLVVYPKHLSSFFFFLFFLGEMTIAMMRAECRHGGKIILSLSFTFVVFLTLWNPINGQEHLILNGNWTVQAEGDSKFLFFFFFNYRGKKKVKHVFCWKCL